MQEYQKGTQCLHAGYVPESGEPRNIPIVQSTTFRYGSSEAMGALFDLEAEGYFYTRLQNPTSDLSLIHIFLLPAAGQFFLASGLPFLALPALSLLPLAAGFLFLSAADLGLALALLPFGLPALAFLGLPGLPLCPELAVSLLPLQSLLLPLDLPFLGLSLIHISWIIRDREKMARWEFP